MFSSDHSILSSSGDGSPNSSSNSSMMSSSSAAGPMDMSMGTPMASPCFPMPSGVAGGGYLMFQGPPHQQMLSPGGGGGYGGQQIAGFEEAAMLRHAQAQANAHSLYNAWWLQALYQQHQQPPSVGQQAGPSPPLPTARSLHHDMYSHPYAMHPRQIHQAFQQADAQRKAVGRVPFTQWQLDMLRNRFEKSDTIRIDERREFSKQLGLSDVQIKVWFQNRRFKLRKEARDREAMMGQLKEDMEAKARLGGKKEDESR